MHIIKKLELAQQLDVKHTYISNLLNEGTIVETKNGAINLDNKKNRKYFEKRKEKGLSYPDYYSKDIEFDDDDFIEADTDDEDTDLDTKDAQAVKLALLNEKLIKEKKSNELLEIKIATQKKELVETAIMNKVIMSSFDHLFKELVELPFNTSKEIIDIVKTDKEVESRVTKLLTELIKEKIDSALENSQKATKRYYGVIEV